MEALRDFSEDALGIEPAPRQANRLFISGTDMASGRNGATAIGRPSSWIDPLLDALSGLFWMTSEGLSARYVELETVRELLADPRDYMIITGATARNSSELVIAVGRLERRAGMANLISLLNEGAEVIFLREPAYHGFDWTVYSTNPLTSRFRAAWIANSLHENARAFTLQWHRARGEHRFHFEHWALDDPQEWMEEIV